MTPHASRAFRPGRPVAFGVAAAVLIALSAGALAQKTTRPTLDVPYVPTPPEVVERMLDMARVTAKDYVIDLGSGDGRIAIAAAKRGARALGVDIDPERITEAQANAKTAKVEDKVTFRRQNLFETKIGEASVLTMYLLSKVNLQLRPRILDELKPGTRVVSHAFDMDDWKADQQDNIDGRQVFFWIVPAKVAGNWQVQSGNEKFTVRFEQKYQVLEGTAQIGGKAVPVRDASLRGTEITFTITDGNGAPRVFKGRVTGDRIEAVSGSTASDWRATRAS